MFEITDASGAKVWDSESFEIETKNHKNKLRKGQVLLPSKNLQLLRKKAN